MRYILLSLLLCGCGEVRPLPTLHYTCYKNDKEVFSGDRDVLTLSAEDRFDRCVVRER